MRGLIWLTSGPAVLVATTLVAGCATGTDESDPIGSGSASDRPSAAETSEPNQGDPSIGTAPSASASGDGGVDLYDPPIADAPDPEVRGAAASRFVTCTHGIANGGWSPDFGAASTGAASAEEGLQEFLDEGLIDLPTDNWARQAEAPHRVLFTHQVDGEAKVAAIIAHTDSGADLAIEDGWIVEVFATCDPSEFDPSGDDDLRVDVWTDVAGERIPTSTVTSYTGPAHCGWTSVTFLVLDDRQYVRDAEGALDAPLVAPYDPDTDLPAEATDTGYRHDDRQLWLSSDESVAFMVGPDRVEAWPSPVDQIGCA